MISRYLFWLSILLVAVPGCDTVDSDDGGTSSGTVLVINLGNFGDGNGSVTVHEAGDDPSRVDQITGFGSILQSAAVIDDNLYLMANSANRVDIFEASSLEQVGQITGVISPRYMVSEGTSAYVTNFYAAADTFSGGNVTVIDLATAMVEDVIPVGNNPEGLAIVGGRLYVANHEFGAGRTLTVIDRATGTVIDTVDADCDGPRFIFADAEDDLFVFCTGQTILDEEFNVIGETDGAVRILDGATGEIIGRISVDGPIGAEGFGQDAFYSEEASRIFVVRDRSSVMVFDTGSDQLVDEIGPIDGDPISAVAFDAARERLYLGRSAGYVQQGALTLHLLDGEEVGSAPAGVVPSYIILPDER